MLALTVLNITLVFSLLDLVIHYSTTSICRHYTPVLLIL